MAGVRLSAVVPAYNEEMAIPALIERLRGALAATGLDFEVVVVDDGSTDGTFALLTAAHADDPRIKAIRLARNFGKEAALLAGLAAARGHAVLTLDADLQHPPELVTRMVEHWHGGAKIVHGVKRSRGRESWLMKQAAHLFYSIFRRFAQFDLESSSDLKLLDRSAVDLLVNFPERTRFFRGLAQWVGGDQATVEFDVQPRHGGATHWQIRGLITYAVKAITAFSSLPLQLVPLMGVVMLLVSIALSIEALISRLRGNAVSGFATLEITILFSGSLIMLGLGIIGQYLARIFDEVKQRPHYVVRERIGIELPAEARPVLLRASSQVGAASGRDG